VAGETTWGLEAVALSAGSCIEWLRDDLGIISSAEESEMVAQSVAGSDGVTFVPAFMGLGTPIWDFGARGLLQGLSRGSGRGQIVRAVLEGIAQRSRDLVDAAEQDSGQSITTVRVDGGMSANNFFLGVLADALERPIEISPVLEATTLGAGYAAQLGSGNIENIESVEQFWTPRAQLEPTMDPLFRTFARDAYLAARERAERTIPDLSAIDF
jgi:glycerol kinase